MTENTILQTDRLKLNGNIILLSFRIAAQHFGYQGHKIDVFWKFNKILFLQIKEFFLL